MSCFVGSCLGSFDWNILVVDMGDNIYILRTGQFVKRNGGHMLDALKTPTHRLAGIIGHVTVKWARICIED